MLWRSHNIRPHTNKRGKHTQNNQQASLNENQVKQEKINTKVKHESTFQMTGNTCCTT